ncbi:DUF397 domain-containing protein [Saccharopolyspora gloriosae]|uniref:DUF397 domain-containing protein n=1 Tax=Saccharopolyspora gloriosae TaxID=455344 RepID=UPI0037C622F6
MSQLDGNGSLNWRKSSFSGGGSNGGGQCVEAAALPDGRIAAQWQAPRRGCRVVHPC